jgi:hypothetical protein
MKAQDWHAGFVQSLQEASDIERQRRAWVGRGDPSFPAPTELVCQIVDDSGLGDLLAEGVVFSKATDDMLRRLCSLAAELDLSAAPGALLSSEGWIGFAREAARALGSVRAELAE